MNKLNFKRVSVTIRLEMLEEIDARVRDGEFGTRSEFFRQAAWNLLHGGGRKAVW